MKNKKRVMTFVISEKMHSQIKKRAYEENNSLAEIIRKAVEEYIKKRRRNNGKEGWEKERK